MNTHHTHRSEKWLHSALVHPDTQLPLEIDWEKPAFPITEDDRYKFGFRDGVPFVLPLQRIPQNPAEIHQKLNTTFDYEEHYIRDAEFFDYFEEFESKVDRCEKRRLNETIVSRIPSHTASILDVGCGSGWLSRIMVSDQIRVVSMDISFRNPVEALRQNPHPNHEGLIADVFHLPLRENTFDCIVASEIMEHVPDPRLFLEKLLYVLKPGGKLIITTPYNEKIQYHMCVHCNRPTPAHAHLHSFHEKNISGYLPTGNYDWNLTVFSHKYLAKSRMITLLNFLPISVWKSIDRFSQKVWKRPMRLMVEFIKKPK